MKCSHPKHDDNCPCQLRALDEHTTHFACIERMVLLEGKASCCRCIGHNCKIKEPEPSDLDELDIKKREEPEECNHELNILTCVCGKKCKADENYYESMFPKLKTESEYAASQRGELCKHKDHDTCVQAAADTAKEAYNFAIDQAIEKLKKLKI